MKLKDMAQKDLQEHVSVANALLARFAREDDAEKRIDLLLELVDVLDELRIITGAMFIIDECDL